MLVTKAAAAVHDDADAAVGGERARELRGGGCQHLGVERLQAPLVSDGRAAQLDEEHGARSIVGL